MRCCWFVHCFCLQLQHLQLVEPAMWPVLTARLVLLTEIYMHILNLVIHTSTGGSTLYVGWTITYVHRTMQCHLIKLHIFYSFSVVKSPIYVTLLLTQEITRIVFPLVTFLQWNDVELCPYKIINKYYFSTNYLFISCSFFIYEHIAMHPASSDRGLSSLFSWAHVLVTPWCYRAVCHLSCLLACSLHCLACRRLGSLSCW